MPLVSVEWPGRPSSEHPQCVPLLLVSCIPYLGSVLRAHKLLYQVLVVRQFSLVLSFEPVTWQQPSAAHTRMPED